MRGLILLGSDELRGLIMPHEWFTADNNPIEPPLSVWRVEERPQQTTAGSRGSRFERVNERGLVALSNQVDYDQIHHSVNFEAR